MRPSASKYAVGGGTLKIETENGDLYGGGGSARNLILQKAPSGAWEATTKVTIDARDGSQQAGLLLYADDDNYVKAVLLARQNQRFFEIVQEISGQPRYDAAQDRLNVGTDYPTTFYVRLTQAEGTVVAAASPDGTNWTQIGRTANASTFANPRVGMTAVTNDTNHVTEANFDWFRIQRSGGPDTTPPSVSAAADGIPTASGAYLNHATVDGRPRPTSARAWTPSSTRSATAPSSRTRRR